MELNHLRALTLHLIITYSLRFSLANCLIEIAEFKKVEDIGVEPMTLCVQGRCSGQLS